MDENRIREAIELLQREISTLEAQKDYDEYGQPLFNESLDVVIGGYELAIKALEKQLPEKPILEGDGYDEFGDIVLDEWLCPNCNTRYEVDYDRYFYCPNCGQKIKWSEEDE